MSAPLRTFTVSSDVKPCDCGRFSISSDGGSTWDSIVCGQTTKRTFAPGHDARLKGHMIRAAVAERPMRRIVDGSYTIKSALEWADVYGFGYLVRDGVALALSKASTKKAPKAPVVPATPTVRTVAEIMSDVSSKTDLSREDEQTVRDALGTFIDDPAEAEALAYGNSTADLVHIHNVMDEVAEQLAAEDAELVAYDKAVGDGEIPGDLGVAEVAEVAPPTVAKVGRHQYEGELIDGDFHYNDRKGNPQVAKKFTLV